MKSNNIKLFILVIICLSISGCGNKGDLYLPEKQDDTTETVKKEP